MAKSRGTTSGFGDDGECANDDGHGGGGSGVCGEEERVARGKEWTTRVRLGVEMVL